MNAHRTSRGLRASVPALALGMLLAVAAPGARGATFNVNADGSAADATPGNGSCATAGATCTLHAAIQESNALAAGAPHTITFSIPKVTLTASLPAITRPVTIDGGGSRTEISGGPGPSYGASGGFVIQLAGSGTTLKNLVVNWMGGVGIAVVDGGNSIQNCYVGTNTAGTAAKPNNGAGISVTTTASGPYPTPPKPPDVSAVLANNIGDPSDPAKGNLISGNLGAGVDIFGERTVKTIVANNLIGTNAAGSAGIPNVGHGVSISGWAYKNTIGPGNLICGDPAATLYDGISIQGKVWEPNVVTGNIIGASKDLTTNLGFGRNGIRIDATRYDPLLVPEVVTLGPANIIGFSGEEGILVTGACERVRIFGNFVGIGAPAASPGVWADVGNQKEGIRITTSGVAPTDNTTQGHLVGGTTPADANVVSANGKIAAGAAGIALSGSSATDTKIRGNVIGRDPLNLVNFPNSKDGIWISGGGNNTVGGTALGEGNVIAGNGRNGVKLTGTGTFANLVSGNSIFGNGTLENGLGIDLEYAQQGVDPTDNGTPGPDPNTLYANYGQNAPVVSTGVDAPYYDTATGNTVVDWSLDTSAATPITLEFFVNDSAGYSGNGEGKTYLGKTTVVTNGSGHAAGVYPVVPSIPVDTRTKYLTMTATPTNLLDPPGTVTSGPANNTSEFSNAVRVPNPGVLQFSAPTYGVGESAGSATITVTRTGGSDGAVSVDYATSDGSATQPGDYTTSSGTLNWADADSASKTFSVPIGPDSTYEGSETVNLALSNPGGHATLGANATATLTIADDDPQPSVSIAGVTLPEGNAGLTPFVFAVALSNPSAQTVSVSYATADGTAFAPGDYVAASGTVTFLPGSVAQIVTIDVVGEGTNEADEVFTVGLSGPVNATLGVTPGVGTIQNDDAPTSTFSITSVSQLEGNAGTSTFTFAVSLSPASAGTETVQVTTADGTATTADGDYVALAPTTLTFAPGDPPKTVNVTVNGDGKREPDETFTVALGNNSGTTAISPTPGTGTILNDDPVPSVTIADVSALEGNAGTTPFSFTLSLSNPSSVAVSVDFATADGTATLADSDYLAASGTATFPAGSTSQNVVVNVNGDTNDEGPEFFVLNLTNGVNAGISDTQGQGNIQNDDSTTPTFAISGVTHAEGNAGTTSYVFTVTLAPAAPSTVTVQAATSDGTATTADGDYAANTQTLSFAAGVTTQTFTVTANGDTKFEPTETFTVTLSANSGATAIGTPTATGTISNDDTAPTISITDASALEGNSGTTPFTFNVTLSNASYQTVTVDAATADGTATQPGDYATAGGTLTFAPGVTTQPVTVNVAGETTDEPDETFFVNLTNPTNASLLDAQGVGTIQNDDSTTPTFTIANVSQAEANAGTSSFVFTVTLSPAAASTVTVQAATADGTATVADGDYAANTQTLSFNAGVTTQTFSVTVNGDTKFEAAETFAVNLTANSAGTAIGGGGTATGTITNDDSAPTISITDVTAAEGNSGTTPFTFNVTLSNASYQTVTVDYATADGTATQPGDYAPNAGTLTFAPGVTTQPATVNVAGETTTEPDETFFVNLTNPANASLLDAQGVGTIQNDDSTTPTFTVGAVTQGEGNAGTSSFVFTVTLSPTAASTVTVQAATADGTATVADGDYAASTQTLTFNAGVSTQTFAVTVNGDTKFEPTETFAVNLTANSAGTAIGGGGTAAGTITNDDAAPTISIGDVATLEGNSATTPFTFNVTLSNASSQTVTVDYATADGTATQPGDYAPNAGTLTFAPGVTTQPATVNVAGETTDEPDETFFVNLTNPANASILDAQGLGTILNDDSTTPTFTITNVTQAEGNAGTTLFTFTVSLAPAAAGPTSVQAATADGTATAASGDYVANTQTLNFAAGVTTQTFTVTVNGDGTFEPDETFSVNLSANSAGTAIGGGGTASGTITGDDPQPAISMANVSAPAAAVGSTTFTFTLTLSNPSAQPITVNWTTADGTASAAAGDYVAASGTVTFPPGTTTMTITITITTNATSGPPKTFFVNLSVPVNATLATLQATGTILAAPGGATVNIPVLGGTGAALLAFLLAAVGVFAIRRLA